VFNEKLETLIPPRTSRVNLNHVTQILDRLETVSGQDYGTYSDDIYHVMGSQLQAGSTGFSEAKLDMDLDISVGAIENKKFLAKLKFIAPKGKEENGAIQFKIEGDLLF
jgi:HlyD family secretion protein